MLSSVSGKKIETTCKSKLENVTSKTQFTSLVRKLIENSWWVTNIVSEIKKGDAAENVKNDFLECDGDFPHLDAKDLLMLMSPYRGRVPDNFIDLAQKLSVILPFKYYSLQDTEKLIQRGSLRGYSRGSELFHGDDKPLSAYFILSGEVHTTPVEREGSENSPKPEVNVMQPPADIAASGIEVLKHGHMLGLDEVLIGFERKTTAVVAENLLCIRFEKKYILMTLKRMLDKWIEVAKYLKKFNIFKYTLPDVTYSLSKSGVIKRYRAGKRIDISSSTYFLVEGELSVGQRLVIEKHSLNGKENYRLHHNQKASINPIDNLEEVFMHVCVLRSGSFFGLGDRLSMNIVWTIKPCKFIKYKRDVITKFEKTSVWEGGRMFINELYPTTEEIFQQFLYNRKWCKYKKEVLNECKKNKLAATIHDVPIPIRCRFTRQKKNFMEEARTERMREYLSSGALDSELLKTTVLDVFGETREMLLGQYKTEVPTLARTSE